MGRGPAIVFHRAKGHLKVPSRGWVSHRGFDYCFAPVPLVGFVRSPRVGVFRVDFSRKRIDWQPAGDCSPRLLWAIVTGRVLGLLLPWLRPSLVLHASVLKIRGEAVAILGPSTGGKSTLAAALLNHGASLLCDDIAVVEGRGRDLFVLPGLPEIRLWPEAWRRFRPEGVRAQALYPGARKRRLSLRPRSRWDFTEEPMPLRAAYLLSRKKRGGLRIEDLGGREALLGMVQNAYNGVSSTPRILRQEFEIAARLIQKVPVKRLVYPTGFSHLPGVCRAILEDLPGPLWPAERLLGRSG